jgi:hypothetical protein
MIFMVFEKMNRLLKNYWTMDFIFPLGNIYFSIRIRIRFKNILIIDFFLRTDTIDETEQFMNWQQIQGISVKKCRELMNTNFNEVLILKFSKLNF